jgi:hypothetical protein
MRVVTVFTVYSFYIDFVGKISCTAATGEQLDCVVQSSLPSVLCAVPHSVPSVAHPTLSTKPRHSTAEPVARAGMH